MKRLVYFAKDVVQTPFQVPGSPEKGDSDNIKDYLLDNKSFRGDEQRENASKISKYSRHLGSLGRSTCSHCRKKPGLCDTKSITGTRK
jgi:hypothetical protein